jgi:hypothetical protein
LQNSLIKFIARTSIGSNPGTNIASASTNFNWNDVVKKEAMGGDDMADLGEVQEVGQHYILTQREA